MPIQIQFRRGTSSTWATVNPTLALGEMGIESDTSQFKIGNGSTAWNSLSYGGLQGPPLINVPPSTSTTIVNGDKGKYLRVTSTVTINTGTAFVSGDVVSIYNNSTASITVSTSTGITLRLVGTATTGDRSIPQRGLATILCVASNEYVITGTVV